MKPVLVEKYVDVGRRPHAWHAFAVKPIVNLTMHLDEQDLMLLTDTSFLYVPTFLISIILMITYLNCSSSIFSGTCTASRTPSL